MKLQTGKASLARRALACMCSLALGAALVPAVSVSAFAADKDPVVLSVQLKDDTTQVVTSLKKYKFTMGDLKEKAAQNTTPASYMLNTKKGVTVFTTSNYVTADQLLDGIDAWTEGASLEWTATDGFTNTTTYQDAAQKGYFYPKYSANEATDSGMKEVVPVVTLSYAQGVVGEDGETAQEVEEANLTKEPTEELRYFRGNTSAKELLGGNTSPSKIATVSVVYPHKPFTVYGLDTTTNKKTELGTLDDAKLKELAGKNTNQVNYLLQSGVYSSTSYIKLADILKSYKQWTKEASVTVDTPDHFTSTLAYADVYADQFFYPNYTTAEPTASGAVAVEPVLTMSYTNSSIGEGTASDAVSANANGKVVEEMRLLRGNTSATDILRGNSSPSGVNALIISYDPANVKADLKANTLKVSTSTKNVAYKKVKKSAQTVSDAIKVTSPKGKVTYAKKSGDSKLSINKSTGKITVKKGTKKGTHSIKVTVKAAGNSTYKAGSKTVTVKVKVK